MERKDGRKVNEIRPVKITPNFLSHPAGSVLMEMGGTRVLCAATFEPGVPPWMRAQNVPGGWLTCEYGLLPSSTHTRSSREAAKGKQSGRTLEIQRLIGRALRSIVDLDKLGPNTFYIDCDVMDADGGTRCASITGACVALALACEKLVKEGVLAQSPLKELAAAVSIGMKEGELLLDLCYEEDSSADVDMNIVMTSSGRLIEVQGTAEEVPFTRAEMNGMLDLAEKGLSELFAMQKSILGK